MINVEAELIFRSNHLEMFFKKFVLKTFAIFTGKHPCGSPFLIKLQARPATLLKRDSNGSVFLWILQNFKQQLFYRTPMIAAFVISPSYLVKFKCFENFTTKISPEKFLVFVINILITFRRPQRPFWRFSK